MNKIYNFILMMSMVGTMHAQISDPVSAPAPIPQLVGQTDISGGEEIRKRISLAALRGDVETLQALIKKYGAVYLKGVDARGSTPFHSAAECSDSQAACLATLKILRQYCPTWDSQCGWNSCDKSGSTPRDLAARAARWTFFSAEDREKFLAIQQYFKDLGGTFGTEELASSDVIPLLFP